MDTTRSEPPSKSKRRWVTFSVRGLLVFVLVFGLWLGWVVNRTRNQRLAVAAIREYGGFVHYDHEFVVGKLTAGTEPWEPRWTRQWLGDDFFQNVEEVSLVYGHTPSGTRIEVTRTSDDVLINLKFLPGLKRLLLHKTQATDTAMAHVGRSTELEGLWMWDAAMGDEGIARLEGLSRLKSIHVSNSKLTDASLKTLSRLPWLETLSLQGNHFTDEGLAHIKGMKNVKGLYVGLGKCDITDAGLVNLSGFDKLRTLDLQRSKVTDRGLEHLKKLRGLTEI
jgi:hypothetical protein